MNISHKHQYNKNRIPQKGFSVVGLLVALALSGVLVAGLMNIFVSNQGASRMMFSAGSQQESARAATDMLVFSLRQAGHFGGVDTADITNHADLSLDGIGECNTTWITDTSAPIRTFDGANSIAAVENFPDNCIASSDYSPNTDIVTVKYASAADATPVGSLDEDTIYIRTIIGGSPATEGQIFYGDDGPSIGGATDPIGTYNYKFISETYYIRACSVKISGTCQDTIPSLVRLQLDEKTYTEHLLVEGVEQFQTELGIDTDGDLTANEYVSPSAVTSWEQVISLKFNLIIRGSNKDSAIQDNRVYSLIGGTTFTPSTADKHYKRRLYSKVVQLRNMSRG